MTKPNPTKEGLDALRFDLVGFIRTQIVAATPRLRLAEHLADNDLLGSAPPPEYPREQWLWVMSSSRPPPRDDPGGYDKILSGIGFELKGCKPMIARKPINVRRTLSRAALAGLAVIGAFASSYANPVQDSREERKIAMTMKDDLANRSPDIHWPQGFDPVRADLFAHNALMIDATCERVWRHIIAAPKWPEWYPNSKDVRILVDGATVLDHGTTFRWTTFGLPLESRINEFVPYSRIGWYGYSPGAAPNFYHTWYLTPQGDACLVVTDEVGMGRDAAHLREVDESLMHRGHDLWLATLKWVSESNSSEE